MTTTGSPEVTSRGAAEAYANGMVASFAAQGPNAETYISSLATGGVGGQAIDAVRRAQEATQVAGGQWAEARDALRAHFAVEEAYGAHPDAGDKAFSRPQ